MQTIISRAEAKAQDLKHYFTGKACGKGHVCDRYVSSWSCVECDREKSRESSKRWRDENPEKSRAQSKRWKTDNPEKHRANVKGWKKENPYATQAINHNTRAKKAGVPGRLTADDVASVYEEYGHTCATPGCGATDDLTLDHIIPTSRRGHNVRENLQVLCRACNRSKRDRDNDVFMASRANQPTSSSAVEVDYEVPVLQSSTALQEILSAIDAGMDAIRFDRSLGWRTQEDNSLKQ